MSRNIPHLRGLQAFDVAAERGNLSRAADELGVTHGAVSRQIKQLEDYLGVPLLHRRQNGVEKTEEGERLHLATRRAFAELREGVRAVRRTDDHRTITISLAASLATKWLVSNLAGFRTRHPGISVFLDTNDEVVDLRAGRIDVALRYGVPGWPGLHTELLTREDLIVIGAPRLVAGRTLPMAPEAIAALPLLHDDFNPAWERWARMQGLSPDSTADVAVRFADSSVMIAAAIDGQGVALARRLLAQDDLNTGRLVQLDDTATPADRSLYFVCRPGDEDRVPVRQFRDWLFSLQGGFP